MEKSRDVEREQTTIERIDKLDPRGSGLLFFMFTRPQPYTCLGIEWLTPSGAGVAGGAARVVYYFSCLQGPNPTPVWELNG